MSEINGGEAAPQQQAQPQQQQGADLAPPPSGTFLKPPAGPGEGPKTVPYPVDYVDELRTKAAKLSSLEQQWQAEREAAEAKQNEIMAQKGEVEQAFANERNTWQAKLQTAEQKYTSLRDRLYSERLDATINEALMGRELAGGDEKTKAAAASYARKVLRDDLIVVEGDDGTINVVDKASRRPAADVLRERLSSPELAIFLAPSTRGGSGTDGARPPANPQSGPPSLLDEMVAHHNAAPVIQHGFGLGPRSH